MVDLVFTIVQFGGEVDALSHMGSFFEQMAVPNERCKAKVRSRRLCETLWQP